MSAKEAWHCTYPKKGCITATRDQMSEQGRGRLSLFREAQARTALTRYKATRSIRKSSAVNRLYSELRPVRHA
jgi:hypothetical protein